jgi:transposase
MEWSGGTARAMHHPTTDMNTNRDVSEQNEKSTGLAKAAAVLNEIFLGIDTSARKHVVTRFIPGEGAKPAEGMHTERLLTKVATWVKDGVAVHCVYEAGPTGFALYRQLVKAGAKCLVVRAKRLERHQRRRKNDPQDSRILAEELAAHHFGRTGLLVPVRIPSEQEELDRLAVRERETINRARHQILNSAKGRALALGYTLPKQWWRPRVWPKIKDEFPPELARLLERTAQTAAAMKTQLTAAETELKATAPEAPVGVGQLTAAVLEREVCSWQRFESDRKLSSFAGMCPCEDSSAERRQLGAIDKHGSPRLRFWCQETAWRLFKHQPDYHVIIWARRKMAGANSHRIKQIALAVARRFLVDWWKVRTGQTTFAALGLRCAASPSAAQ